VDDAALQRLLAALAAVPEDELAKAATDLASMRPQMLRRLIQLAAHPGVAAFLGRGT
jgi:hypothetical protein